MLSAVFVPTVFIPGITGRLYQQFALTIAISVIFSAFNALSLSPALCTLLLRPRKKARGPLGWFYDRFNRIFGSATKGYVSLSRLAVHKSFFSLALLLVFAIAAIFFGSKLPASFLPEEDQGGAVVGRVAAVGGERRAVPAKLRDAFAAFSASAWQFTHSRVNGKAFNRPGLISDSQLSHIP